MNPSFAISVFIVGIAGLFFLDRSRTAGTSKALWLPVIWFWISGSRSVSVWLGIGTMKAVEASASNPLDEIIAGILIVVGIVVVGRRRDVYLLLRRSWPIALYFTYCLASVMWSDSPGQGFKRWVRALGDLVMVVILVTDPQPIAAVKRFLSRVGFVLLPTSALLLKYYPTLGRIYDVWGNQMSAGVATDKNMLGVLTFVIGLGTVWQVLSHVCNRNQSNRARHLLAQCVLLYFAITLLMTAHSATSGACFALGAMFMLVTALPPIRRRPAAVHALILAIVLAGGLIVLLGGEGGAARAVGREGFTGRSEVWATLIPMAPNPILGAGFESFWFGPRLENLWRIYPGVNEAHNGYLEVYLNLGLIGLGLIVLILLQGYRKAVAAFRQDAALGALLVAYLLTAAIYSITEAGFRMFDPIWFCLLLAILAASRVTLLRQESSHSGQTFTAPAFGMAVAERWSIKSHSHSRQSLPPRVP